MKLKKVTWISGILLASLGAFSLSAYAEKNMTITLDNQSNCIVSAQRFNGTYGNFWGSTNENAPVTLKEKGQKVPIQLSHTGGSGVGSFEIIVMNKSSNTPVCYEFVHAQYGPDSGEVPTLSRSSKGCGNYLTGFGKNTEDHNDFALVYHSNKACDASSAASAS